MRIDKEKMPAHIHSHPVLRALLYQVVLTLINTVIQWTCAMKLRCEKQNFVVAVIAAVIGLFLLK
jgi:hypothetical protein